MCVGWCSLACKNHGTLGRQALLMKRTLETFGYRLRNVFGSVKALTDIPEKFKEEPCKKKAAITRPTVTVLPTIQFKPLHGCMVSLQTVQQIMLTGIAPEQLARQCSQASISK